LIPLRRSGKSPLEKKGYCHHLFTNEKDFLHDREED